MVLGRVGQGAEGDRECSGQGATSQTGLQLRPGRSGLCPIVRGLRSVSRKASSPNLVAAHHRLTGYTITGPFLF